MFNAFYLIISLLYITDMLLLVPKYTRCKYDHTPRKKKLLWKAACIAVPLLILIFGVTVLYIAGYGDANMILLCADMALCAAGDIVIEVRFFRGGLLFGFAHIVYITAMFLIGNEIHAASIVCFLILVILGTALSVKYLGKKYRLMWIIYNLVISASFAMGLSGIFTGEPGRVLMGYGVISLVLSDWLLARNKAFGSTYGWSLISLILYFGGQMMISAFPYLS